MKSLLSSLFILSAIITAAQVPEPHILWMKSIGGSAIDQVSQHVTKTADGGFVIAIGTVSPPGSGSLDSFCAPVARRSVFVKYNSDATTTEWSKCYGSNGDSSLAFIFPQTDGSDVLGGVFKSSNGYGVLLKKYSVGGTEMWQVNHSKGSGHSLRSMIATVDGGYLLLGGSHYTDTNASVHYGGWDTYDFWLLRVDVNGNKIWSRVIGGSDEEDARILVPAPSNGFYIAGTTGSNDYDATGNHGGADIYVVRCDDTGGIVWHRCLGGSDHDLGTTACSNGKGGILVAGYTLSEDGDVHHHIGEEDYWVLEIDSAGNIVWENCYGVADRHEQPGAVCRSYDGSIWIIGTSTNHDNKDDAYLVHIDSVGNLLQSGLLQSNGRDNGQLMLPLPSGYVLSGGCFGDKSGNFSSLPYYGADDIFLAAFAPWPASLEDVLKQRQYKIYPNPTDGILHIEVLKPQTSYTVIITDIAGRKVLQGKLASGMKTIDLKTDGLMPGFYVVDIVDAAGVKFSEKIEIR